MKKLRVNDEVIVTTGKDRGKKGKISKIIHERNKIVINGINTVKKHLKPTKANPRSGIIDLSMPMSASNVQLICPKCSKMTRVHFQQNATDKLRICAKCKEVIKYESEK